MPLFRREQTEGDREAREAAAARAGRSLAALERGELPLRAQQRLAELGAGGGLFTSDLSVNEFALGAFDRAAPVAQVMGSSIYHVGWQQSPGAWAGWQAGGISQELTTLSEAWNTARLRAFGRLEQEATLLGAHAVVGVRLTIGRHDWAAGVDRVRRGRHRGPDRRAPAPAAAGADRSLRAGLLEALAGGLPPARRRRRLERPLRRPGLAAATGAGGMFSSWANQELRDFTQGVYDARETALGRVTAEARRQGAAGVVGVSIAHAVEEREASLRRLAAAPTCRDLPRPRHGDRRARDETAARCCAVADDRPQRRHTIPRTS